MTDAFAISKDLIGQLVDGTIDDDNAERLLKLPRKDKGRFLNYIEVLQERVQWKDKILLRLGDKLYVVRNAAGDRVVVISTANGLKFTDFKRAYHADALDRVHPTYAHAPIELPNDYDAVCAAIDRAADQRSLRPVS